MKKLILILSFFIILSVLGQEVNKFFEVEKQTTSKFKLGSKILTQSIKIYNDFLSGFSLWIDNDELSDITIKIKDNKGSFIFNENFTLPVVSSSYWGKEYFFSLGDNIKINSGDYYEIIIESQNISKANIYYLPFYELLQGSEESLVFSESINELLINNELSGKILKIALYEGKEYMPPQIFNFKIENINDNQTKISFNANEPVEYNFEYFDDLNKTTSTYKINYFETCPKNIRDCSFIIKTEPDRKYNYVLKINDFWKNFTILKGEWQTFFTKEKENIFYNKNEENNKEQNIQQQELSKKESENQLQNNLNLQKKEANNNLIFKKNLNQKNTDILNTRKNTNFKQQNNFLEKQNNALSQELKEDKQQIVLNKEFSKDNIIVNNTSSTNTLTTSLINQSNLNINKSKESYFRKIYKYLIYSLLLVVLIALILYKRFK
jgi:signal peptidase I